MNLYPPGTRIAGQYEVAGRPLMGGMGIVYLCLDHGNSKRPVALKTFKPEYLPDRAARDRFLREGTTWVNLGAHPHIVRAYEVVYVGDGTEVYIALELVAKEQGREDASLRSWLTPGKPLPLDQALLFALQIARGMKHATEVIPGFVHRDLKPENVLVGADKLTNANVNRLRVTDFGLASVLQSAHLLASDSAVGEASSAIRNQQSAMQNPLGRTQLTRGIVGTPLYMAPEQWKSEPVSVATDVYALGCILVEMLTGQRAVEGKSVEALQRAHCAGQVRTLPTNLPESVQELTRRCLTQKPEARWGKWAAVEAAVASAYAQVCRQAAPEPEAPQTLSRAERVAAGWSYINIGASYRDIGKAEVALDYFEQAVEVGRAEGEQVLEGAALVNLGLAYADVGDAWRAIGYYEQGLALHREISDRRGEGAALGNLGLAYADLGDVRRAIGYYEQGLAIDREIGDRHGEGIDLGNLGSAYLQLGDARRAIGYFEQALAIAREIGDRRGEGAAQGNLGIAYAHLGEARRAIGYYEQALAIRREIGDRRGEGNDLGNLGNAYADLGDVRRAIGYYEQDLAIAHEIGDRRGEGTTLNNLGEAYRNLGDARRATDYYELALTIAREIGDRQREGNALGNLGIAYRNLGDVRQAIGYYGECLTVLREIGDRRGEGQILGNLGVAYAALGNARDGIRYFGQALTIRREIGDAVGVAADSFNMALLYAQQGKAARALPLARQAAQIWGQIGSPNAQQAQQLVARLQGKSR